MSAPILHKMADATKGVLPQEKDKPFSLKILTGG